MTRPQACAIVVEWANTDRAGIARGVTLLSEVERQVQALAADPSPALPLSFPVQLLVVQPDGTASAAAAIEAMAAPRPDLVERVVVTSPQASYYGLKNHGAALARGDIVVFVDSDVVPEPGWLAALLAPLADPAVQAVGGHASIAPGGVYHKAFALAWFFPLMNEPAGDHPSAPAYFANNVAFRRQVFARFPFDEIAGTSRGACLTHARRLAASGIRIHRTPAARVTHPPPSGLAHFAARGLAQGRDRLLRARQAGDAAEARLAASIGRAARNAGRSLSRIATLRREVGLSAGAAPVAALIALAYYGLYFAGELMTHASPQWMTRRFRV